MSKNINIFYILLQFFFQVLKFLDLQQLFIRSRLCRLSLLFKHVITLIVVIIRNLNIFIQNLGLKLRDENTFQRKYIIIQGEEQKREHLVACCPTLLQALLIIAGFHPKALNYKIIPDVDHSNNNYYHAHCPSLPLKYGPSLAVCKLWTSFANCEWSLKIAHYRICYLYHFPILPDFGYFKVPRILSGTRVFIREPCNRTSDADYKQYCLAYRQ